MAVKQVSTLHFRVITTSLSHHDKPNTSIRLCVPKAIMEEKPFPPHIRDLNNERKFYYSAAIASVVSSSVRQVVYIGHGILALYSQTASKTISEGLKFNIFLGACPKTLLWSHSACIYAFHVFLEITHMNIFLITFFLQYLLLQVNSCLGSNQYTDNIKITTSGSNVYWSLFLLWRYNFNDIINQSNTNKRTSFLVFTSTNSATICFILLTSPDSVACRNCAPLSNTWRRKDLLIAVTPLCMYY